jgi:DNA-binding response OmpR family regulator
MAAWPRIVENAGIGPGGDAAVLARRDVPPGKLPARGAKILIVDDEADVIQALKVRLETAGYDAVTACDGAEALAMLQKIKPDLILADLMMPNLDGLELTRRVRQNPSWFRIQVLLFSCNDDPVARELALEFGALDYLSKTVGARGIVSRVNEILAAAMAVEGATGQKDPEYEHAERDLIAQLRAVSENSAAASPAGPEVLDATLEGPEQSGRTGDDLQMLGRALARNFIPGSRHHPDSDR